MAIGFDEPYQLDLPTIWRGLPWGPTTITISDSNGTPIDLTNYTISAKTPLFNLNPTIITPAAGLISLMILAADTATLPIGNQPFDVTGVTVSGGFTKPFFAGNIPVKQPVSL